MDGQRYRYPMDGPYWEHGHGNGVGWIVGLILLALLIALLTALAYRLLAGRRPVAMQLAPAAAAPGEDALAILRLRYARGEIDRDQFLQATADLGGAPPPPPPAPA